MYGKRKDTRACEGCGLDLPLKMPKKMKVSTPGGQFLCKTCARVRVSTTYLFLGVRILVFNFFTLLHSRLCIVHIS